MPGRPDQPPPVEGTRLVVPLLPQDKVPKPFRKLHPVVAVSDQNLVMATHLMLAVPESSLGRPLTSLFPR
ncbi:MAG TPA: CcdB family protein [Devosia sp.]|uniref:CcdB family protein n=1 Tax=Devosia sp. TaxID=1871048 RepID=UPI002DDD5F08|nr:CcdB family protein [Devosia sp.]HEV2517525.1 CcdB family protein [Devosia sp.]